MYLFVFRFKGSYKYTFNMISLIPKQGFNLIKCNRADKKFKICMSNKKNLDKTVYDVVIVGGGHSGFEAAMASSKRGASTLLLTLNLDKIGWQPCNPSIGGPAKSTLVHEVDALGGWMGKVADRSYLTADGTVRQHLEQSKE